MPAPETTRKYDYIDTDKRSKSSSGNILADNTGPRYVAEREPYKPPSINPRSTSGHETLHIGAANGEAEWVTIKPTKDYEGATQLKNADMVAAVGPDAAGADGTGYDMFLARMSGQNMQRLRKEAISRITRNQAQMAEVENDLRRKKTLRRAEIAAAWQRGENKMKFGEHAKIWKEDPPKPRKLIGRVNVNPDGSIPPIGGIRNITSIQ